MGRPIPLFMFIKKEKRTPGLRALTELKSDFWSDDVNDTVSGDGVTVEVRERIVVGIHGDFGGVEHDQPGSLCSPGNLEDLGSDVFCCRPFCTHG